jgi:hypothetical protein
MLILSAPPSKGKLLGLMSAGLASATLGLAASPAQALTQFAGDYAPANWTFNANGGDGSVDTTSAPSSITLSGNDNNTGGIFTNYTINASASGNVSFNWVYNSIDSPIDEFGYLLNGNFNFLSNQDRQTGTTTFAVASGDLFGFSIDGSDGCCGNGNATISNFNGPTAPASVPGPLPILCVGAAFVYSRRLKRRINLAKSPVSTDSVAVEQL